MPIEPSSTLMFMSSDDMRDAGAIEQRSDGRNQDRIIGADELAHGPFPSPAAALFRRCALRQVGE